MRKERKKTFTSIIIIVLITFLWFEELSGNPMPGDTNWEASPVPINYYGPIFLKQEHLNITFDSVKVDVEAIYIFKNTNETELNLTILLPFANYDCQSPKPEILNIKLDGEMIDYCWSNNSYNIKSPLISCSYYYIEYNITFSAFEERIIIIHYLRDYMRYGIPDSCDKTYYGYIYTVGSARAWNHPIELAHFQFWIPKSICDNVRWADYIMELGNNISSITSQQDYYMASLQYNDWIPPSDKDIISLYWSKTNPWLISLLAFLFSCNPLLGILIGILIIFIMLAFLIMLIINFKKRWKRGSDNQFRV